MTEHQDDPLPRTTATIRSGFARGLQTGVQLFVSQHGDVVVDDVVVDREADVTLTRDALMPLLSAAKPLTVVAVLQLVERGRLDLDAPVADVIPEFAAAGKEAITTRYLLTHTGGFRDVDTGWPHADWEETLHRVFSTPLEDDWVIGESAGYHVASSWFVLGELIRRIDGRSFAEYLRDEVCRPLEMEHVWNGMPEDIWRSYGDRIGRMKQVERGETRELPWHDFAHCEAAAPGGNTRGPVRELGRFYNCLLNGGSLDGTRILRNETVSAMTSRHRVGAFDQTLQHVVDFGLGVIVDSNCYGVETVPYGYSRYCSERTFGHGGSQSSIGFADPEHGLVVCYVADRRVGEARHQKRHREIVNAIYEDLTLTKTDSP
ncbi:MAG: serine hydrolase domain-containing protein [Planctomycetota bacterium]|jgi:CubicO group peptidase (beta-lactamase class C family)